VAMRCRNLVDVISSIVTNLVVVSDPNFASDLLDLVRFNCSSKDSQFLSTVDKRKHRMRCCSPGNLLTR